MYEELDDRIGGAPIDSLYLFMIHLHVISRSFQRDIFPAGRTLINGIRTCNVCILVLNSAKLA